MIIFVIEITNDYYFHIQVERDLKIGKLKEMDANYQKLEILGALQKLGEALSSSEITFLTEQTMRSGKNKSISVKYTFICTKSYFSTEIF